MIYHQVNEPDPIRQGDIFLNVPRFDISLNKLPIFEEDGCYDLTWNDIIKNGESSAPIDVLVRLVVVNAIVVSHDCDNIRSKDIILSEIQTIREIDSKCKETKSPDKWVSIIIQHSKINMKWFYLPPSPLIGFSEKMAADFRILFRIPRLELEQYRFLRKGCLFPEAKEHFAKRLSEFFGRYPYNEWYPLNHAEFKKYKENYPSVIPYEWQREDDDTSS
jgi:hypothetical protein